MSMCYTEMYDNQTVSNGHESVWRCRGIAPFILNLGPNSFEWLT